jgi:putative SOS response-associated peptidase YedK
MVVTMCGRFDTSHLTWRQIHDQLANFLPVTTAPLNLEPHNDVRPTTAQLAARVEDGAWVLEKMRWGLVPFWRNGKPLKDTAKGSGDGFKLTTFNCRVETCSSASTFKGAFAKRRCIVPATAWYEWTGEAGSKVKHVFRRADGQPIWFAGLWDRCTTPDAGEVKSFTIMTGPSAGQLSDYHDRAPVILEPEEWSAWLDPARDAEALMAAVRPERFEIAAAPL